jgi:hypothetical protein
VPLGNKKAYVLAILSIFLNLKSYKPKKNEFELNTKMIFLQQALATLN